MQKIREVFKGKSSEEERGTTGMGASAERGAAYGQGVGSGTSGYPGEVAGGPAHGSVATGYTETQGAETRTTTTEVPMAVQQTTTTTTTMPVAETTEVCQTGGAAVCAQEFFTKTEDRPIVKERVEYIQEHRPVEKEFVVETRATGVEREMAHGRYTEVLGTEERIVSVTPPKPPCE